VMEGNCYAAYQIWTRTEPGKFSIPLFCHRDSADGDEHKVPSTARVLNEPANTKFTASFFGGLLHHDYWVLDHAEDYGWMIASTSDGKYSSILARKAGLPKREAEALVARAAGMGLNTGKLVHVGAAVE
jgi:apolipoprotein D and lipocalin family protein